MYSNEGERELSRIALKAPLVTPRIWHLRLYKNDYFPNRLTALLDLVEATFSGYAPVPMDPALWSDPVTVADVAVSFWGPTYTQFTCSSGTQQIFGYYVTFDNGAKLLYSQRFDNAQTVSSTVRALVWPQVTDHSEYQPDPPP